MSLPNLVLDSKQTIQTALGAALIVAAGILKSYKDGLSDERQTMLHKWAPLIGAAGWLVVWYAVSRMDGPGGMSSPRFIMSTIAVVTVLASQALAFYDENKGTSQYEQWSKWLKIGGVVALGVSLGVSQYGNSLNPEGIAKSPNTLMGIAGAALVLASTMWLRQKEEANGDCNGFAQPALMAGWGLTVVANAFKQQ